MSLLCCCFRSRPKEHNRAAREEEQSRDARAQFPSHATPTLGPVDTQIKKSEGFPSLQLDLDGSDSDDERYGPSNHGATNTDPGASNRPHTGLIRHLSLDSLSRKRRSRLEVGRSREEIARRDELRRIRHRRIQDELENDEHIDEDRNSSMHSCLSVKSSAIVLKGGPREGLEFSVRTHSQQRSGSETDQKAQISLPPVMGLCPESIIHDAKAKIQDPRRNSCPDRFARSQHLPSRKNSQASLKSLHSAYSSCYPRNRLFKRSRTSDMASMVSWRMSYSKRTGKSLNEERLAGASSPSVKSCRSRSDLNGSIPEKDLEMETLGPLEERKEGNIASPRVGPDALGKIHRSQSAIERSMSRLSTGMEPVAHGSICGRDDTMERGEGTSSIYATSGNGSPSTHTASILDVRELKVSRSSIIRLALPTWSGSSRSRCKSSDYSHKTAPMKVPTSAIDQSEINSKTAQGSTDTRHCSSSLSLGMTREGQSLRTRRLKRRVTITGSALKPLTLAAAVPRKAASQLDLNRKHSPLFSPRLRITSQEQLQDSPSNAQHHFQLDGSFSCPNYLASLPVTTRSHDGPGRCPDSNEEHDPHFIQRTPTDAKFSCLQHDSANIAMSWFGPGLESAIGREVDALGDADKDSSKRSEQAYYPGRQYFTRKSAPVEAHGAFISEDPQICLLVGLTRRRGSTGNAQETVSHHDNSTIHFPCPTGREKPDRGSRILSQGTLSRQRSLVVDLHHKGALAWQEPSITHTARSEGTDHALRLKESSTTLQFATPKSHMSSADERSVQTCENWQSAESPQSVRSQGTMIKQPSSPLENEESLEEPGSIHSKSYQSLAARDTEFESGLYKMLRGGNADGRVDMP